MEEGKSRVMFARKNAALNVCAGKITSIMVVDIGGNQELYLPVTGGRCALTDRSCPHQTVYNDFEVRESWNPRCFVLISMSEGYVSQSVLRRTLMYTTYC